MSRNEYSITVSIKILNPHAMLLCEYLNDNSLPLRSFLVIADLHLGFEYDLLEKGVRLNSKPFTQEIESQVYSIVNSVKPDSIIILGDIKDSVTRVNPIESNHIPHFLKTLSKKCHVYIVPGNHDAKIQDLAPDDVSIASSSGLVIGDTLFLHGHTMPSCKKSMVNKIVMGHLHPVLNKPESILNGSRVWVFLRVRKNTIFKNEGGCLDLVIVPSMNRFITATPDYRKRNQAAQCAIMKRATEDPRNIDRALIACLDGFVIGDHRLLPFVT